jgi:hypothetical protein
MNDLNLNLFFGGDFSVEAEGDLGFGGSPEGSNERVGDLSLDFFGDLDLDLDLDLAPPFFLVFLVISIPYI